MLIPPQGKSWLAWAGSPPVALSTVYNSPRTSTATTEANVQIAIPYNGVLRNFIAMCSQSRAATSADVLRVRVNGVDTALTVTITAGGAATDKFTDSTDFISVSMGDLVSVSWVTGAVAGGSSCGISLQIDAS